MTFCAPEKLGNGITWCHEVSESSIFPSINWVKNKRKAVLVTPTQPELLQSSIDLLQNCQGHLWAGAVQVNPPGVSCVQHLAEVGWYMDGTPCFTILYLYYLLVQAASTFSTIAVYQKILCAI